MFPMSVLTGEAGIDSSLGMLERRPDKLFAIVWVRQRVSYLEPASRKAEGRKNEAPSTRPVQERRVSADSRCRFNRQLWAYPGLCKRCTILCGFRSNLCSEG